MIAAAPAERVEDCGACLLCPGNSDVNLLRYGKGIIDLDAEVPDWCFRSLCARAGVARRADCRYAGRSRLPLSVVANAYRTGVGLGRRFQSIRRQAARIALMLLPKPSRPVNINSPGFLAAPLRYRARNLDRGWENL
jgi:hypothetical protein